MRAGVSRESELLNPTGSVSAAAVFTRVEMNTNAIYGLAVDGEFSTGKVETTVFDSIASGNVSKGFVAFSLPSQAPATLMLFHSVAANNGTGLDAFGTGATIRVAQSIVSGNANGWLGVVLSAGNNTIEGNASNETAPPTYTMK